MRLIDLINPELRLQAHKNQFILSEEAENSKLRKVHISEEGELETVTAFSVDKEVTIEAGGERKLVNEFLNAQNKLINRRCDGVVIYQKGKTIQAVICEMKSEKLNPQDYEYQLQNVGVFVDYLLDLYRKIEEQDIEIFPTKYVLFYVKKTPPIFRKERIVFQAAKKGAIEKMNNFDDSVIKYPCNTSHHNYVKLSELLDP